MQNISTAMSGDANYLYLQEIPVKKIRADVACFLVPDETYMQAFQTVRDQVIFTNKRVIVVSVQGGERERKLRIFHTLMRRCSILGCRQLDCFRSAGSFCCFSLMA